MNRDPIEDAMSALSESGQSTVNPFDGLPSGLPGLPELDRQKRGRRPLEDTEEFVRDGKTLDDLYSKYTIGTDCKIRVDRLNPSHYQSRPTKGWLCDFHEQKSLPEIQELYGGGTYRVTVLGLQKGDGNYVSRDSVVFTIPGPPKIDMPQSNSPQFGFQPYQQPAPILIPGAHEPPEVAVRRLELEAQNRQQERAAAAAAAASGASAPQRILEVVSQVTAEANERVAQEHSRTNDTLRSEIERLRGELDRASRELNAARAETAQVRAEAAAQQYNVETHAMRELRDRQAEESRRVRDDYDRLLAGERQRYQEKVDDLQSRHSEALRVMSENAQQERNRLIDSAREERDRLQADSRRATDTMERAHDREIAQIRDDANRRIEELRRSYEAQINTLDQRRQMEVLTIQETGKVRIESHESTAKQQVGSMKVELERVRAENDQLRSQVEEYRTKLYRSPIEAIKEAQELLDTVGVGTDEEEAPVAPAPTTADRLFDLGQNLVKMLPQVAKNLSGQRQDGASGGVQLPPAPRLPQRTAPMSPYHPPVQQLQPVQPQRNIRRRAAGPVPSVRGGGPTGDASNLPIGSSVQLRPQSELPIGSEDPMASFVERRPDVPIQTEHESVEQEHETEAPPQLIQLTEEQEKEAKERIAVCRAFLEDHIQNNKSPEESARAIIELLGSEQVSNLLKSFDAQKITAVVQEMEDGIMSSILTPRGQEFLSKLVDELRVLSPSQ